MAYSVILVDVFNLFYRKQDTTDKNPVTKAANCIEFIEKTIRKELGSKGKLYLIFDPIPKQDYGYSNKFSYTNIRTEIDPGYKKNRKHDACVQESVRLIREFYKYRGPDVISVYGDGYEADDFVESIVKLEAGKKIALFTTDMDWARYLAPKTDIINKGFNNPYTVEEFEKDFNYYPTITTVSLYKAFYGDDSDNIVGVRYLPKVKFISIYDIDDLFMKTLNAYRNKTLTEFCTDIKSLSSAAVIKKMDKTVLEQFFIALESALGGKVLPLTHLLDNNRIIKSRCKDASEYFHSHAENEKANKLIEAVVGFTKDKKQFKFGGLSLS